LSEEDINSGRLCLRGDDDLFDLGVDVVLAEAETERWGDFELAFAIGVGDDLGMRTGADMAGVAVRRSERTSGRVKTVVGAGAGWWW
jgi:hypothetical protein